MKCQDCGKPSNVICQSCRKAICTTCYENGDKEKICRSCKDEEQKKRQEEAKQ